ncbi:MAG: tetratricopeptide (TPR) repeat protein [Myxococcota bacterium]|jgi:tetratricopeptide (TPR) repeat protein
MVASSETGQAGQLRVPTIGWIVGPRSDFLLVVGTPLLIVPLILLALQQWQVAAIYAVVASLTSVGHHLPGMMRAYGDSALFARFKLRFILAPIVLATTCLGLNAWQPSTLKLLLFCWGVWHLFMQAHGLARIYDGKVGSTDSTTVRLDFLLLGTWFVASVILADLRFPQLISLIYDLGAPAIDAAFVMALREVSVVAVVGVTSAYVINAVRCTRAGTPPSPVKHVLHASNIGFYVFCNLTVEHILLAVLMFELFHNIQYLTIVWAFNRRRADTAPDDAGAFTRFLFRQRWYLVVLYVGLVLGYGALSVAAKPLDAIVMDGLITGLISTSALLHFYFDGFIWKLREAQVRQNLQAEANVHLASAPIQHSRVPDGAGHVLKWAVLLVVLFGVSWNVPEHPMSDAQRYTSLTQMAPSNGKYQGKLAEIRAHTGDFSGAIEAGRKTLGLLAQDGLHAAAWETARGNLVSALMRRSLALLDEGDEALAATLVHEAVALDGTVPTKVKKTANSAYAKSELKMAEGHFAVATIIDPRDRDAWIGLARVQERQDRIPESLVSAERASELAPDVSALLPAAAQTP